MDIDISLIISVGIVVLFALIWAIWSINQQMKHGEELGEIQETVDSQGAALKNANRELEKVRKRLELIRKERTHIRKKRYEVTKERNEIRRERDELRKQLDTLVTFLVETGVVHADFDPLSVSEDDLLCEIPETIPELPAVNSLDPSTLVKALKHAAERDDSWADRPFSRRYMVKEGPLSRPQLKDLRAALLADGYLQEPEIPQNGYKLTDEGQTLLQYAVNGAYEVAEKKAS